MNKHPNIIDVAGIMLLNSISAIYGFFRRFWCFALVLLVVLLSSCEVKEYQTESGIDCVAWGLSLDCNWDEYNLRTSYGCGATLTVDDDFEEFYKDVTTD